MIPKSILISQSSKTISMHKTLKEQLQQIIQLKQKRFDYFQRHEYTILKYEPWDIKATLLLQELFRKEVIVKLRVSATMNMKYNVPWMY